MAVCLVHVCLWHPVLQSYWPSVPRVYRYICDLLGEGTVPLIKMNTDWTRQGKSTVNCLKFRTDNVLLNQVICSCASTKHWWLKRHYPLQLHCRGFIAKVLHSFQVNSAGRQCPWTSCIGSLRMNLKQTSPQQELCTCISLRGSGVLSSCLPVQEPLAHLNPRKYAS